MIKKLGNMEYNQKRERCGQYLEALEEERRKIHVFQRELPLCLDLVTQGTYIYVYRYIYNEMQIFFYRYIFKTKKWKQITIDISEDSSIYENTLLSILFLKQSRHVRGRYRRRRRMYTDNRSAQSKRPENVGPSWSSF